MKNTLLLVALLAPVLHLAVTPTSAMTPSPGCGADALSSGTFTLDYDGLTRTFRVHVPAAYELNSPTKLIAIFHGWGGNENEFLDNARVTGEADARGYILVAPRGIGSGVPDRSLNAWSFPGSTSGLDGDGLNRGRIQRGHVRLVARSVARERLDLSGRAADRAPAPGLPGRTGQAR